MTYQEIYDKWSRFTSEASKVHGVRETLVLAVIRQESSGRENAHSTANCVGLMQLSKFALMDYNKRNGTDLVFPELFAPKVNIEVGTWYLAWLIDIFKDDFKALRAYNVGIGTVKNGGTLLGSDGTLYATSVLNHEKEFLKIVQKSA